MTDLLNCPFCGSDSLKEDASYCIEYGGHEHQDYSITCNCCSADMCIAVGDRETFTCSCCNDTRAEAVKRWNTRAETKALQDDVKHWEGQWEHASNELIEACKRANTAEKEAEALTQRLAEVEGLIKSAYMEGFSDGHSEGLTEGHPLGTNGRGSDANWGDSDIKQALSNSEGKPKCPKHETGGGPCYCDKQGGSDDHK